MPPWNRDVLAAYAPAVVGWVLALAGWLRLEQLRTDLQAQALVPALQWGVCVALLATLGGILATSARLWRAGRRDGR
ncbi:hypothetical protein [Stenotrophomonas sp. 24(2023)]|uniref:hypothetical protein n=1 Tax=Stenotrophomonas sp. 24(2023) TaxID=3068324 RepID=UPI0027E068F9|nr:hypothetical protein [Stenotrophomonas sp. 24(2023)]WMJ69606.1 hypothetical protein Q9R17_00415 [Stenotrophomonas sp. 24(2023)]